MNPTGGKNAEGMTEARGEILAWMLSEDVYWSPYRFAVMAYPWGEGDLKEFDGPRMWQKEVMEDIEKYLRGAYESKKITGTWPDFLREAVASGRGPGKSALLGMLAHWFMSTRIGGSVWVAANGEPQLRTKTFPEIAKWVARGLNSEFYEINSTSILPSKWFKEYIESPDGLNRSTKYYYISGQLWSAENPDAFAGAHNNDGEMAIFDESSGIPDPIWTVQEGVFTEDIPDRMWFAFSNPRRNSGAFYDCFHNANSGWKTRQINSMTVEGINHATFHNIIAKYGEDSDPARVEVFGEFPRQGDQQFIASSLVREAQNREVVEDFGEPLMMGIDVARFGDDYTVCRFRRGRDARTMPPKKWKGASLVESANRIADLIDQFRPDGVFIDQGMGSGVVDILKSRRYRVHEVAFGGKADGSEWANKRTEMYARMRDWMAGGAIDGNQELFSDLTAVEYRYHGSSQDKIILEPKDELKKRIGRSPDDGDALALTFAMKVSRNDVGMRRRQGVVARDVDYSIFG